MEIFVGVESVPVKEKYFQCKYYGVSRHAFDVILEPPRCRADGAVDPEARHRA
jgi:hypothetical protein